MSFLLETSGEDLKTTLETSGEDLKTTLETGGELVYKINIDKADRVTHGSIPSSFAILETIR